MLALLFPLNILAFVCMIILFCAVVRKVLDKNSENLKITNCIMRCGSALLRFVLL